MRSGCPGTTVLRTSVLRTTLRVPGCSAVSNGRTLRPNPLDGSHVGAPRAGTRRTVLPARAERFENPPGRATCRSSVLVRSSAARHAAVSYGVTALVTVSAAFDFINRSSRP